MKFKRLANSDLDLSVVTFGAWAAGGWLWGGTERSKAIEAIRTSYEMGVTSIDTAPVYGQGTSEIIVGEAIKDIPRDKVQILTKYGLDSSGSLEKGPIVIKPSTFTLESLAIFSIKRYASLGNTPNF